jgi:glutamate-1-semialdehyde 2,1-aminomutase
VTSIGSLVNIHFTEEKLLDAGASLAADADAAAAFHLGLLNRGIFIATRGLFAVSTVTTEAEIDQTVEVAGEMLAALA